MAVVYITEFSGTGSASQQMIPAAQWPPLASQTVAIGATSVQSAAFNAGTTLVRINTDAPCSIAVGANPTATAALQRFSGGATEYFTVNPNSALKIAVITNT